MSTTLGSGIILPGANDNVNRQLFVDNFQTINDHIVNQDVDHVPWGGTSTNVGNVYSISSPAIIALVTGMSIRFKCNADSSGAVSVDWDTKGAKSVKKPNGLNVTTFKNGGVYTLVYDGVNFQLQGEGGEYGTATASKTLIGYSIGTEDGVVNGTMSNRSGDTVASASEVSSTTLKLLPTEGYRDGVDDKVTITDSDFIADNIKTGINLFGKDGTFTADANAIAADILSGKSGYVNGAKVTGTMPDNGAVTITPSLTDQTISAGYHNGSGKVKRIADMFTYVSVYKSLTAPSSPSTNDIWIKTSLSAGSIYFQNTQPSAVTGRLWIKISGEYIDIVATTSSLSVVCNPRSVSRDYDTSGGKASTNVRIMTSALYDLWVALGFVQQYNGSSWVYCPAYYWNGSAWVQHSWGDMYAYGGSAIAYKIAQDDTATVIDNIETDNDSITRTDPNGNVFVSNTNRITVRKHDNSGTLLWTCTPSTFTTAYVYDICHDLDGNIYALRKTASTGFYVTKISPFGSILGEVTLPTANNPYGGIRVDHNNRLLVLTYGTYMQCYTPDWDTNTLGTAVWSTQIVTGSGATAGYKLGVDNDGNSYVSLQSGTGIPCRKITNAGVSSTITSIYGGIAIVTTPSYIYFIYSDPNVYNVIIKKLNYSLSTVSTVTYDLASVDAPEDAVVDRDGYVYILVRASSGDSGRLVKLPPDSNVPVQNFIFHTGSGVPNWPTKFDVTPGRYSDFPSAW